MIRLDGVEENLAASIPPNRIIARESSTRCPRKEEVPCVKALRKGEEATLEKLESANSSSSNSCQEVSSFEDNSRELFIVYTVWSTVCPSISSSWSPKRRAAWRAFARSICAWDCTSANTVERSSSAFSISLALLAAGGGNLKSGLADCGDVTTFSISLARSAEGRRTFKFDLADGGGVDVRRCRGWPADASNCEDLCSFRVNEGIPRKDGKVKDGDGCLTDACGVVACKVSTVSCLCATWGSCLRVMTAGENTPGWGDMGPVPRGTVRFGELRGFIAEILPNSRRIPWSRSDSFRSIS